MERQAYIAIALAALALWLLARHVIKLLRGEDEGCGCCSKTGCQKRDTGAGECPSANEAD